MYSLKGSWAGQAFALASANDSGGKKSRIRRSKEERKSMVESFIKRYQSSNNGSFPSLNLTHKEVGGSFYTVREIFREIIQENRVLGPGQFSPEETKDDSIVVNYPLGSISSEPQAILFQTASELNAFTNQQGKETVVLNLDNNGQYTNRFELDAIQYSTEHRTDKMSENADELARHSMTENLVSDYQEQASLEVSLNSNEQCFNMNLLETNGLSEESDKLFVEGSLEHETFVADAELEQKSSSQANLTLPTEEVEVETFPLKNAIKDPDDLGSTSTDSGNFDGNLNDLEAKMSKLSDSIVIFDKVSASESSSDLQKTKVADSSEVSVSGESPDMLIQHAEVNYMVIQHMEVDDKSSSVDMPSSLPIKNDTVILHDCNNQMSPDADLTSKRVEQNNLQPKKASEGATYLENSNATNGKNAKDSTAVNRNDIKREKKATIGSSPPLDRIDLESWKASKHEINPLVALFKAFVDAFARFWSE